MPRSSGARARHDLTARVDRARGAIETHDFVEAARLAQDVLDGLGSRDDRDVDVEVRALTILACAVHEVGGGQAWDGLLDRASDVATGVGRHDLLVAVLGATGYCHLREGRPDAALEVFERADPWLDRCSVEDRVRLLLNRGTTHLDRGSLDAAADDLERAAQEAAGAGLAELAHKARHNRGYLAFLQGDLPAALDQTSVPTDDESGGALASIRTDPLAGMDRARILLEAGLVEDADALLAEALVALQAAHRLQDEGEAHLARARGALVAGDFPSALEHLSDAADRFARRGNRRWLRRTEFTRLAVLVEELQGRSWTAGSADPAGAGTLAAVTSESRGLVAEVAALVDRSAAAGDTAIEVPARAMLAEAALLAGDRPAATAALSGGGPGDDAPISVRLRWYRARAGLAVGSGDDVQAIVRQGLAALSEAQQRVGSMDLRTAMAIHGRELAELGVADALATGDPDVVHLAVERSHASSTRLAPVRTQATTAERELLAELRRIGDARWRVDPTEDPDREQDMRRREAVLRADLRRREWARRATGTRSRTVRLRELRDRLTATGAVAASFVANGADLCALRIDGSALDVVSLGSMDEVGAEVERLRADLQAVVLTGVPEAVAAVMQRSVRRTLHRLDELLVRPLDVGRAPLVVVPHGPLALVPWPLLAGRRGLATTTAPCLTEWVRSSGDGAPGEGRLVALAGPGLERAEAEVASIGGIWPDTRTLVGSAATGAAVHEALASADVVHLATHGTHRVTSPLFSSLQLADGPLVAHELGTDLAARLVVLSSCEVGSHTVRRGDEPLGLTAALLQADVATVLASLARVRDDVAHDVMLDVHRDIAAGVAPAAALGTAVASALDDGRVAPFTCVGAGLVPVVAPAAASSGHGR